MNYKFSCIQVPGTAAQLLVVGPFSSSYSFNRNHSFRTEVSKETDVSLWYAVVGHFYLWLKIKRSFLNSICRLDDNNCWRIQHMLPKSNLLVLTFAHFLFKINCQRKCPFRGASRHLLATPVPTSTHIPHPPHRTKYNPEY